MLQAFSKLGPVLNATIAKKRDPNKPGVCAITLLSDYVVQLLSSLLAKPLVPGLFTFHVSRKYQSCGKFSSWHVSKTRLECRCCCGDVKGMFSTGGLSASSFRN